MKVFILLLVAFAALSAASPKWHQLHSYSFDHFKADFPRQYSCQEEHDYRRHIFDNRLQEIKAHNADHTKTWKMGVNKFTDWTKEELASVLGYKHGAVPEVSTALRATKVAGDTPTLPSFIDWRRVGVVTPVKDQGKCGSCWSFATAESVESAWALANQGQLAVLSEQHVLDCTANPMQCGGTGGCGGGTAELGFEMIKKNGGLSAEWTYPYLSYFGKNQTCQVTDKSPIEPAATISDYVKLPSNEYDPLMQAVATVGPIAISVEASTWFAYESGVFDGCNKTNPDIDHAVQLVGYGTDETLGDFWLVRNSWSPAWGEQGYIRLKRNSTVSCGMDITPQDGSACKNQTAAVKVCGTCGILYDTSYPII